MGFGVTTKKLYQAMLAMSLLIALTSCSGSSSGGGGSSAENTNASGGSGGGGSGGGGGGAPAEDPIDSAQCLISGSGPVIANGSATSTITITLKKASGAAAEGVTPTFNATDTSSGNNYGACSASDSSGVSTCTLSSTYAESKTLTLLTPVSKTGSAVNFTSGGINLEVPIELMDYPVGSASSANNIITASRTTLDTNDYDGSPTYDFELIATNSHSSTNYSVTLRNGAGTTVATLSITANTTTAKRFRVAFTPTVGADNYTLRIPRTNTGNLLVQVYSARILVKQTGATKTRLYIPMLSGNPVSVPSTVATPVDSTTNVTYTQVTPNAYPLWKKDVSVFKDLPSSAFELEAVLASNNAAGTATVGLHNVSSGNLVTGSEVSVTGTTVSVASVAFDSSATEFNDLTNFTLKIKSNNASYTASIYKAGLWVTITNLTRGEVCYRASLQSNSSTTVNFDSSRWLLDGSLFSHPTFFFGTNAFLETAISGTMDLQDHATNDSGTAGTATTGSGLIIPASDSLVRSSSFTITNSNRYYPQLVPTGGTVQIKQSCIWVGFDQWSF